MSKKQTMFLICMLLLHGVLMYLLLTRRLDFLFNDASHRIGPGSDFWALYNAGKHWLLGSSIYDRGPGFGFRYHPILAMTVLSYISRLDYDSAYWVWVAGHEALLLATVCFFRKLVPDTRHFLVICGLLALFSPYYLEVYMGNASFVTGALLLVAFCLYKKESYLGFFALLIASILIKPIGLMFLPFLALRRHVRLALLVLVIIIGLGVPYFVMYPADWDTFVGINFDGFPVRAGFLVHAGNQGFYALLLMISAHLNDIPTGELHSLSQLPLWNGLLIRSIPYFFVLMSLWITYRLRGTKQTYLVLFLWLAAYLLGYKDTWEHTYSLMIFGLVFLYLSNQVNRTLLLVCSCGLAFPTAFVFYDMAFHHGAFNDPGWHWGFGTSLLHHLAKPVWVLILYTSAAIQAFRVDVGPADTS